MKSCEDNRNWCISNALNNLVTGIYCTDELRYNRRPKSICCYLLKIAILNLRNDWFNISSTSFSMMRSREGSRSDFDRVTTSLLHGELESYTDGCATRAVR